MNYCPNCGYHLTKLQESVQPKTQFPPPGFVFFSPQQQGILGNGINFPPNYYVTSKGALNGTETRPMTTFPPNSVFSTVSIPPIMGHWGGSPTNEQVSFITGKDYGTKTSTKG